MSFKSPEAVFTDFLGRRNGILKALTTEVDQFYAQCDPERENMMLYGYSDGTWEVNRPGDEVPPELPEPALGINFARNMNTADWLTLVAAHSDAWLMAVASFHATKLHVDDRRTLFNNIASLPSCFDVVDGRGAAGLGHLSSPAAGAGLNGVGGGASVVNNTNNNGGTSSALKRRASSGGGGGSRHNKPKPSPRQRNSGGKFIPDKPQEYQEQLQQKQSQPQQQQQDDDTDSDIIEIVEVIEPQDNNNNNDDDDNNNDSEDTESDNTNKDNDDDDDDEELDNSGWDPCPNCGREYRTGEFWIQCDCCDKWFDGRCVNMNSQKAERSSNWNCPFCARRTKL